MKFTIYEPNLGLALRFTRADEHVSRTTIVGFLLFP
jgi:hypothetical protein